MKNRIIVLLLMAALLTGCHAAAVTAAPATVPAPDTTQPATTAATITAEEAQAIALAHAGFTADQVTRLYAKYEMDRGIPKYDVEFHQGRWEYDYDIQAETGEILSFEKDD